MPGGKLPEAGGAYRADTARAFGSGRAGLAPFVLQGARLHPAPAPTARFVHPLAALIGGAAVSCWLGTVRPCRADDPRPEATKSRTLIEKAETEFTIVPFAGGNSDMGFGGGYVASLARLEPGLQPYRYRIETAGTVTLAQAEAGGWRVPYTDIYLLFSVPNLIKDHLGLDLRVSHTLESNLKYYGLGNASRIPDELDPSDPYFEHSRTHPTIQATLEYRRRPLAVAWGLSYTQNWFDVPEGTLLAEQIQSPDPDVSGLLRGAGTHGTPELSLAVAWDTRDDETSPGRGLHVTERLDVTPGTFGAGNYRFARLDTAVHLYVPLIAGRRRVVFAVRVVNDLLFGDPPFYELPRFADTFAIGGPKGVRGVPGQRYYGKIKLISNFELRSELFSAPILGEERRFGFVAFADFGRLWTDYRRDEELDGSGLGLKYGLGGGLRLAAGETFVLRADLAWSPDANPVGGYLLAGHLF